MNIWTGSQNELSSDTTLEDLDCFSHAKVSLCWCSMEVWRNLNDGANLYQHTVHTVTLPNAWCSLECNFALFHVPREFKFKCEILFDQLWVLMHAVDATLWRNIVQIFIIPIGWYFVFPWHLTVYLKLPSRFPWNLLWPLMVFFLMHPWLFLCHAHQVKVFTRSIKI